MEAVVLGNFDASEADELSCRRDDLLVVLRPNMEMNWSLAVLYQKEGLVPKNFIRIKPIPGFMGNISRQQAEEMLKKTSKEGLFLIRESESSPGSFTISVFTNGNVKHAMINNDAEYKFRVYDRRFSSINLLIEHHCSHSIARSDKILLVHPVPESLVLEIGENFTARDKDELTVNQGDRVIVTNYTDKNWWIGVCKNKEGMFPVRYAHPINYPNIVTT